MGSKGSLELAVQDSPARTRRQIALSILSNVANLVGICLIGVGMAYCMIELFLNPLPDTPAASEAWRRAFSFLQSSIAGGVICFVLAAVLALVSRRGRTKGGGH